MAKPTIEPITEETLPEFAVFLESNMPAKRTAEDWVSGLRTGWGESRPNYGFLMRDEGVVVGGIGAIYSDRVIGEQKTSFCNITSWCVLDSHRKYSMQLAMNIVGQPGYHFTDFSPTSVVAGALQFLKFKALDEGVAVILNLPINPFIGRVVTNLAEIERELSGSMADILRDHSSFPWLRHLLVGKPGSWCYIIFKEGKFKGFPCANIIYLSDNRLFDLYLNRLRWYFFWNGVASTHVEKRMLDRTPILSKLRTGFNKKQFRSDTLSPLDIDYLYSEIVALDL
jgi:hypothetical protein